VLDAGLTPIACGPTHVQRQQERPVPVLPKTVGRGISSVASEVFGAKFAD
jgi:hypothetical protein